jgi:hypothetical protein
MNEQRFSELKKVSDGVRVSKISVFSFSKNSVVQRVAHQRMPFEIEMKRVKVRVIFHYLSLRKRLPRVNKLKVSCFAKIRSAFSTGGLSRMFSKFSFAKRILVEIKINSYKGPDAES